MRRVSLPLLVVLPCVQRRPVNSTGSKERKVKHWFPKKKGVSSSAAALQRSVDVADAEKLQDVERHFPVAMSHIKKAPTTRYSADERRKQTWKDITRTRNVDGYAPPREEKGAAPSFFDEGSFDIRSDVKRQSECLQWRGSPSDSRTRLNALSPDVLQLSGANPKDHGFAVAEESNVSPADPTIEPEQGEGNAYGDTPVQLTDMLKERLMELKAEKLREDRNDTYLPSRLKLLSDSEVQRRLKKNVPRCDVLDAKDLSSFGGQADTLADLFPDGSHDGSPSGEEIAMPSTDPWKDGEVLSPAAGKIIHSSADLVPGGSLHDPVSDFSRRLTSQGEGKLVSSGGSVHLLRCLPRAGFCSRREALAVIASGQVRVDNVVERNPFRLVRAENNIHVASHSGRLRFAPPRLWMYHKPAHVIVSRNDVAGRALFTKHARILGMDHLVPVGSLPMRAHGLLLLTNDGELSRFLENPKCMIQQTYLLRVRPAVDPVLAHKLNFQGITINGKQYKNMEFFVNPAMKSRFSLKVKVRGEVMPVAHLMQHLGRTVERGGRISFGPFSLSGLPVGSLREVTVPPYYTRHTGAVWKEFVERDWPFFRRQRVSRLRRLARYRELTPRELEELDGFTYEEVKDALSFDSQELKTAADEWLDRVSIRPQTGDTPLPDDFAGDHVDGNCEVPAEEGIIEDITAAV
ncbi:tRNA pseudouridine synthase A, putative [Trypanosoma brucei gambiense DAL972]|uniref:tRNA pseudouridine synthase A, putative n=2 Tax=Trypanosoma brucei TaxID=5691 RepID=D0A313_TRYB9|nr:tRNA pseudouridine synthase A, putative [Trypanosoma brucei gambiense DAL972]RHW69550.1 tRNA pseudouridine synthase A [Trypanosoma brucei equiperdum]CBH15657.1 tRNA pseudouridine synthase A, putative [Trypanosoma brucei gambiense DAL972]|eukprot:XP_011777921.1 tRNA pseudouridine synthase A, putative [Trypanosoma brucei gambiense DAL972]